MSFTSEVKDELARVMPACPQCEKATLAALVRIEGTLFVSGPARYRVEIAPASARLVVRLLHGIYSLKTNLTMRRSVLHKTPNYLIEVPAQPHLADALRDMGVLSAEGGLEMGIKESLVAKPCCAAAYLRGAFLGSGFALIIYLYSLGLSAYQLISSAYLTIEVISSVSSSIGVILSVPLTALISAAILTRGRSTH